jgi:hypothetical protein
MSLDTNFALVPDSGEHTIYSNGVEKKYKLSPEQRKLYEKYKDINRGNYVGSYLSSFSGVILSGICIILLFFEYTRKYAFYALISILILWFTYVAILTKEGNENADKIDKILGPAEIR